MLRFRLRLLIARCDCGRHWMPNQSFVSLRNTIKKMISSFFDRFEICIREKLEMKILNKLLVILFIVGVGVAFGHGSKAKGHATYSVVNLSSLGGTVSRGNSINNEGWVSGYSFTAANSP